MSSIIILTITTLIALIAILSFKLSFLKQKKIAYISLMQYLYLVIVPGILFSLIFTFILNINKRLPNKEVFLNNHILIILLLLSLFYTYGGLAIHAVTKTLSSCFSKNDDNLFAYRINKYFHLKFSHNITYAGACSSAVFLALLETNHLPPPNNSHCLLSLINGIVIGISFIIGINFYLHTRDSHSEHKETFPWSDLKFFFYAFWGVFLIFVYGIWPHLKNIGQYSITLSMFTACLVMAILSVFLYSRRLYRKNKYRIKRKKSE